MLKPGRLSWSDHGDLNNKTRQEAEREKRRREFDKMLLRHLPAWHPKRKETEE